MLTTSMRTGLSSPSTPLRKLAGALLFMGILLPVTASQAATLTAGSPPSSAPTTFLDTKTGAIAGFMPEIAAEVAKRLSQRLSRP
jgi:polar amino acid transport system substrate-binding protein